jgi:hypothetical protein
MKYLVPDTSDTRLSSLAYELLDAHDDTARLAVESASDMQWEAHLRYLRDLQRVGRELLAQVEERTSAPRLSYTGSGRAWRQRAS